MFEVFKRSYEITKLSFTVIWKDKEMLLFPIFSSIFSLAFVLVMLFPTIISALLSGTSFEGGVLFYVSLFIIYAGLAFIATFFNVCVVYTAKKRFAGGNATFFESIGFAFSRVLNIFLWSLLSATVGIILRMIENAGRNAGRGGQLITSLLSGILGMAWAVITVFVVPAMVYDNIGPIKAIKKSFKSIKKTWGESLIRYYGLGLFQFLVILLSLIVLVPITLISFSVNVYLGVGIVMFAIFYLLLVVLVFGIANTVFNTALYEYAKSGKVPGNFNKEVLSHAFKKR